MAPTCDFLLVIPAYEEHQRLPPFLRDLVQQLGETRYTTRIQIVDDGSSANSLSELVRAMGDHASSSSVEILPIRELGSRRGKGAAIRTGWNSEVNARWLAFVDADGAIPAAEVRRVFDFISEDPTTGKGEAFMAVRAPEQDQIVQRNWLRKFTGKLFVLIVNLALGSSFQDPQCGFKIISARLWKKVVASSLENGFGFDLELLLLLKNSKSPVVELPIAWQEKPGGHFLLVQDGTSTLISVARLWYRTHSRGLEKGSSAEKLESK